MPGKHAPQPKISVVVLNYNSEQWLARLFQSLEAQTFFAQIETIVVDNKSSDRSNNLTEEWFQRGIRGRLIKNPENQYFCEGNNTGAKAATGEFLLFLNPDLWLEPDCLEKLYRGVTAAGADAATPLVLDYSDNNYQSSGAAGLDIFGLPTPFLKAPTTNIEIFGACGCSLFVRRELFHKIGGFPAEYLMYAEETDVSWRVWIAGGKIIAVPAARLHHRGAVAVNPSGETQIVESRTSETKRFLTNRNLILMLLNNGEHVSLLLIFPHLTLLLLEALAALVLIRRIGFVRKSYFDAIKSVVRMAPAIRQRRLQIASFRKRGDMGMLQFLRVIPSRWVEAKKLFLSGVPKVDPR